MYIKTQDKDIKLRHLMGKDKQTASAWQRITGCSLVVSDSVIIFLADCFVSRFTCLLM